ncbi:MAG: hypothetical protein P4N24_18815 [Acidobacteriota bacterium]|nr:hypothetical protein [Acidobacteriota bacterium]
MRARGEDRESHGCARHAPASQDGPVEALYFDEDDETDAALLKELQRRLEENADPNREKYSLMNHNCGTLFCETMTAAGHSMSHGPWYSTPKSLFNLYTLLYQWWSAYSYDDGKMKEAKSLKEVVTTKIIY